VRVLVIEDNAEVREILKEMVQLLGAEAVVAENGLTGLELVRTTKFDLVFTDLRMPGLKGTQLVEALKKAVPDVPLVVVSGSPQDLNEEEVRDKVFRIVRKPFSIRQIGEIIDSFR